MIEDMDQDTADESKAQPESVTVKSKYEFVMAASKEAERLNEQLRRRGILTSRDKVTMEAIRRIRHGSSRVVYDDQPLAVEEPGKESSYFFGG
jgi:hypothetical protein